MAVRKSCETQRDLLTGMVYHRGTTLVTQRTYSYDTLGRPLTRSTARNGQTVNDSFVHNSRSELASAVVSGATYGYDYDNIGTRRMAMEASDYTLYEANNLNQYTSIQENEDTAFVPTFDADGNQTLVKTDTGIWSVVYNAENCPVCFTNADGSTVIECSYDAHGRRATKKVTTNGSITLHQCYIYRGYLQIAACDLTRLGHPCLWLLTWDPSQPVATRPLAIQKDGTWYTYGWDLTKNICEVYGLHGYIRTNYSYSPYGEVTIAGDVVQPILWSAECGDEESSLIYYNFRYYNPSNGNWLSRDLIEEDDFFNLYNFIENSPIHGFDELGKRRRKGKRKGKYRRNRDVSRWMRRKPAPKQQGDDSPCQVSVCCKRVAGIYARGHCVIRFSYSSGSVRGCRGGPTRNGDSGGVSGSSGSSNSGGGSSDSSGNVGANTNSQSPECKGCCGYWGNVIAGCGEEISNPTDALQRGISEDLKAAREQPAFCTFIKGYSDEECRQKEECLNSYMKGITSKCYIYKPLDNNSNTSWMSAFSHCFQDVPMHNPPGDQPGNTVFDENARCN